MNIKDPKRRSAQVFDPTNAQVSFGQGKPKTGATHINLGKVRNVTESWEAFKDRFREPRAGAETMADYLALPKDRQDALKSSAGFIIGAPCADGSRRANNLLPRTIVALDFDTATPEFLDYLEANEHALRDHVWFAHTTRKHTQDKPRLRLFVLLAEPVPTALYEPVARILAELVDKTLACVDAVSFRATQLMYLPTLCSDGAWGWLEWDGEAGPIEPDALLKGWQERTGLDPLDARNWPRKAEESNLRIRSTKAEDPWRKPGIIGMFCRAYPIEKLIAEHFADLYAPGDSYSTDVRYSWLHGGTSNGLVIYEDGRFAYSHHTSDPLASQLVNAWDFARLVKFGDEPGSSAMMMDWAKALPEVLEERAAYYDTTVDNEPEESEVLPREQADAWSSLDDDDRALLGLPPSRKPNAIVPGIAELSTARKRADATATGSDTWAGARHAARVRNSRLYESVSRTWLGWSGQRWAALTDEDTAADAKDTSAHEVAEASARVAAEPTASNRTDFNRIGKLHGSRPALTRMIESSRSEPGMHIHGPLELDRDPMSLTLENGILDLATGSCRPAVPNDRVSKLAGCAFDADADALRWKAFLERIMPDSEVRAFLQRFAGYGLTGLVDEEVFLLMHGTGANGKSVFCEVYEALLNEMSGAFGAALVTKSKHENEAARLVNRLPGLRAAFVNETMIGDLFDSGRMKELSSRDRIAARPLYAEAYDFAPTHKLWIRTNHLPGSLDAGDGFWRRCIPLGFGIQIPEAERDKGLARRIMAEELPGVLNWALAGCLEWQRVGLRIPASIEAERRSYREDTDLLGQWLEECTERQPDARLRTSEAFGSFAEFCKDQGASAGTKMSLSRALKGRRFQPFHENRARGFVGLKLLTDNRFDDFQE